MADETIIQHVALECLQRETADLFFSTILGIPKLKNTILSKELIRSIFDINEAVDIVIYGNVVSRFEVFIRSRKQTKTFDHVCVKVSDRNDFVARCRRHGLKPFFIQKDGKQLLFVRDFSGNLFEIT